METILITGAARRLGSLIAEKSASAGCFVWIHYRSHEGEAFQLKERILRSGGQAACVYADLREPGDIDAMLDHISGSADPDLTALINNASVFPKGTLQSSSVEDWDLVMNTNLRAVWYLSSRFAERFRMARRIITIGDASVSGGYAEHALYGLSKFSLKYLTEQMAESFAPGIRVNLVSPGVVLQGESEPDEIWQSRVSGTLTDNSEIVESVMDCISFLMSDPGMTGTELFPDNGLRIGRKRQCCKSDDFQVT